jgi:hypothetical protein
MRRAAAPLLLVAAALFLAARTPARDASAQSSPATLALLANLPGQPRTTLHLVPVGARDLPPPVAALEHLPDAVVHGAPLPDGAVAVAADVAPSGDLSFAATLYRLAPGAAPAALCDRVVHASRPLVAGRRLFVERGRPGEGPSDEEIRAGRLRTDDLTVEEVLPAGPRVVHAFRGYATHLAGFSHGKLLIYRVAAAGADLIAVDPDTGRLSTVATLAPFARDFSVDDRGRLLFAGREPARDAWTVERIDPESGARELLATGASGHFAPHAWPGGAAVWNPDGDPGLSALLAPSIPPPAGPGVDVVRALSPDGAWAAALHYAPGGGMPRAVALRTADGRSAPLPAPTGVRLEIAGFLGANP